ncbi:RES family NAD+ phosphorylase [Corallococcus sp. AB049A]|uniref:RES family NAD+ phosphorylase n=1 Tax=Corallococcus sp. AB049A TaxID=2316721 RepID=UPI0018F6F367|nr:RES family NAD+ phosphorylase [Corallococcus sp. AB049A]
MHYDRESNYEWTRPGARTVDAIRDAAEIPEQAAKEIQELLETKYARYDPNDYPEETEFDSDAHYEEKRADDAQWQSNWQSFEFSLKTRARFFDRSGAEHLAAIFAEIDKMHSRAGKPLVIDAGPGAMLSSLYRARVFQSDAKLEEAIARPDRHVGPPPFEYASAGRMNAHGISVFYGANEAQTALAEVRPPVGSRVVVARFEIIRPLRLLDLTAVSDAVSYGSVFDPTLASRIQRAAFLRSLSARITKPVMPDDERFDYLATQAIADYLATESAIPLDGIVFPSAQASNGAVNVALFHKASRVEHIKLPEGMTLTSSLGQFEEDGWMTDYEVIERVPSAKESKIKPQEPSPQTPFALAHSSSEEDVRENTLRIELNDVKVHQIERVKIEAQEYEVTRFRWEKDSTEDADF